MSRRVLALSCALVFAAIAAPSTAVAAPSATAAAKCKFSGAHDAYGTLFYARSLSASGVSCKSARRFLKSWNRCRYRAGGDDGRCRRRVARFRCAERRFNKIRTQYSSRVTCKRRGARIKFRYTQFV